ncbi:dentin sialophosphoprotein-like [Formica exsecta]|uniref:dentin sialophosphoprotein-like n=1 Tax=Formica exsecta TaxID=72781 RepID=UPI0011428E0C|nr:dentin sialophosphoprotein-like [Formica exsecta]
MSFHETIGWIVKDNHIKDRMIDNSLIHEFTPSSKIRRRTKAFNAKIKKYCGVKDYKQYVKLKTNVVRNVIDDIDTDNSDNLSDTDYDIIYSSLIENKHSIDDPERYIFTEEDCEDFKRKINTKHKKENSIKNMKISIPKRKLLQVKCNDSVSKKRINIKKIAKVETIASENSKEDINNDNILEKRNNKKEKNSSQLNPIDKNINKKIFLTNQKNKTKFVKAEDIQKLQSLSLKENDAKNVHSKSCDKILKEQDSREEEFSDGKVRNSLQLNEVDKDAEIYPIDHEDKNDLLNQSIDSYKKTRSMEPEDSSDNHKQRSLFPKKDRLNDVHSESCDNILEEQDSREEESSDEKVRNSLQLNEVDKDAEIYLINNKDKNDLLNQSIDSYKKTHSTESEDSSDFHKQQSLFPKEDWVKDVHTKSCGNILEEQDSKEEESSDGKVINSLQLNEVDKDAEIYLINNKDKNDLLNQSIDSYKKMLSTESEDSSDIHKQQSLFPKEDQVKDVHSKSCDNILKEQDNGKRESFEQEITNFFQSNQIDKDTEIYSINHQDKTHSVKLKDSCNIEKQQLLPKITYSEIINKKYMIINKQDDNINIEKNDINSQEEILKAEETDNNVSITLETDNEEDNANYISPETKKRLQQQAKLNLVVSSDSNQSDDEYITIETSKKHDSDTSCCSKDMLENDGINCEKINTDILCSKDSNICSKETTPVRTKEKEDPPNIKKEIRKQDDKTILLTSCTYENNNSSKSAVNKNSLKEIQYCGNVYNDDNQNESIEDVESFQLRVSENNISCINEESINQFSRNKSLLDKENFCDKSEDRMSDCISELGTWCKPRHEQNKRVSTNCSNVQLDISSHYRPYNLEQLIEDEKLLPEPIPAGFTLADLSEDDEAFILNVPNKVLQCNLQGQLLSLKEKTIKFGEDKYRIVRRKVGTVSCIFATGKQRIPYKTVNIKEISTITVRERLSHCLKKSDISNSYDTVISFESESSNINNRQTNDTGSKMKVDCNKRKRRSSDLESEQFATKKGRLK